MSWSSAAVFYQQLSVMIKAGLAIPQAVALAGQASTGWHRQRAAAWAATCTAGQPLADALAAAGEEPFAVAVVRAGERSGHLESSCAELGGHYEQAVALRNEVIGRLVYPAVLLHATLTIPTLPGIIMGGNPLWFLLIGPVLLWALVGGLWLSGSTAHRAGLLAHLVLRWPLRPLSMPFIIASTASAMRAACAAGMLADEALELAAPACGNRAIAHRLREAAAGIRTKRLPGLVPALAEAGFDGPLIGILAAGEAGGTLERSFGQVAAAARESFRLRLTWTLKVVTGAIYALAMLAAAAAILGLYMQAYVEPMKELNAAMGE